MDGRIPVCVFAKPPRPGAVKTRLASELGRESAAVLARAFLRDTWRMVRGRPWTRPILAATDGVADDFGLAGAEVWLQGEGDLGQRLERVLAHALRESRAAIAIGADTPGLPGRFLEQARRGLAVADAVLGPCDDGGFYLLGLASCPPGLLASLPWSHSTTYARALARLHERGHSTQALRPWFDVDRPEDLRRLRSLIEHQAISAPETAAALTRIGYPVRRGRVAAAVRSP